MDRSRVLSPWVYFKPFASETRRRLEQGHQTTSWWEIRGSAHKFLFFSVAQCSRGRMYSGIQHNLSKHLASLHVFVRCTGFTQREDAIDNRLEFSAEYVLEHLVKFAHRSHV